MKRVLCLLLSVVLSLSIMTVGAANVSAASSMKTSETAISMIKKLEGFSVHPYPDHGQYTVGYGTRCPEEDYDRYMKYGITEKEADALLRKYLVPMQSSLNRFADKFNLSLSQNQFDALFMFTYNVGTGWTTKDSTFRTAVINGDTGNDFLFAISRWSKAGNAISPGLVKRRLIEADMYLNGSYTGVVPDNYTYVLFDFNDPKPNDQYKVVGETKVQGYDSSAPVAIRDAVSLSGHRFLGWYTTKENGTWITDLDATTAGITLIARWQAGEGPEGGTPASYQRQITAGSELKVYASPSESANVIETRKNGDQVDIVADYVDANNVKWGKLASGGWINLSFTASLSAAANRPEQNVTTVKVTGDRVNIRSGAGKEYSVITSVKKGAVLPVFETVMVDGTRWGRCDKGWICLSYTDYHEATQDPEDTQIVATGKVNSQTNLRVRSGPGTSYSVVGSLASGTEVEITRIQNVGATQWGCIKEGWISLDYVTLNKTEEKPEPTEPEVTEPEQKPEVPEKPVTVTGTVTADFLRIRSGAGIRNPQVGSMARGTRVEILEQTAVDGNPWGRTEKGWICLTYVKLDQAADSDHAYSTGVVTASKLNVRSGAGVGFSKVGTLTQGTKVNVLEQKMAGGMQWGRIAKGWISLNYVKMDGNSDAGSQKPENNTTAIASGVVTATSLRVRSNAGTSNKVVKSLRHGAAVDILEVSVVDGTPWGRIADGWICLSYIRLNSGSTPVAKTVSTSHLNIRSDAGTNHGTVGAYTRNASVVILDQKTVSGNVWGRTEKGWISLKYTK